MAQPRRIEPGATYLVTRRCSQRALRLRPGAETNRIFLYCLALACRKSGMLLHAVCVMSNHHHLVITDPRGALPDFLRELHRLTAKAMNALQGERENLWAAEACNVVRLMTDDDVDERIAYVVANPVAAGLVKDPDEWPGIVLWGEKTVRARRPALYFSEDGVCPPELELSVSRPPSRDGLPKDSAPWKERVRAAIHATVVAAHSMMKTERREFLGRSNVVTPSLARRAISHEPKRGLIPTFAARLPVIRDELRRLEREFRANYRAALLLWRCGERNVVFPFGTWGMRVLHSVAVEPALAA